MRTLLIGLALVLGAVFIADHYSQLESISEILQQGDWRFVGAAVVAEFGWLLVNASAYRSVLQAVGSQRRLLPLVPVVSASQFVSVVAPSAGMSSIAVIVADARRAGYPSAYATIAGFLFVLMEYISFTFFLVVGLGVLYQHGGLNGAEIFATGFLWFSAALLAGMLYLGMRSERRLARALRWGVKRVNALTKLFGRKALHKSHANDFAHKIAEGLVQVRKRPQKLIPVLVSAVGSKALMLIIFWLMFLAFKVEHTTSTLFAGFAISYLFTIVSPTPAGIGVVEGLTALALVTMGVPVTKAAVVILGYRAVTFWLRLFVGMLAMQSISRVAPIEEPGT